MLGRMFIHQDLIGLKNTNEKKKTLLLIQFFFPAHIAPITSIQRLDYILIRDYDNRHVIIITVCELMNFAPRTFIGVTHFL